MEEEGFDILLPGEVEHYVQILEPSKLEDLGTESWFQKHQNMQKLCQQAILEASQLRGEVVKEMLVNLCKIPVLVHEAVCISVWREKVFPILMKMDEEIEATFLIYMIMFHESTAVTFLETVLYHPDSCEALGDPAVDLLDYSVASVVRLLAGLQHNGDSLEIHDVNKSSRETLMSQEAIIAFNIGMRCISILRYFAEFLEHVPLAVTSRMYGQQDIPLLMVHLLEKKPWQRQNPKDSSKLQTHTEGQWRDIPDEDRSKVSQIEGQVWIALRQLLMSPQCATHYSLESHRRNTLSRVQRYMTDVLLDQISPLVELKMMLCHMDLSSEPSASRPPFSLEIIPEIRESLLNSWSGKWKRLAKKQAQFLFKADEQRFMNLAKGLSKTYDVNVLERLSCGTPKCGSCGEPAGKKCSRCKSEWYCGRECQVKSWSKHKQACDALVSAMEDEKKQTTEGL